MLVVDKFSILEATQLTKDSIEYDDIWHDTRKVTAGMWRIESRSRFSSEEFYISDENFKKDYVQIKEIS